MDPEEVATAGEEAALVEVGVFTAAPDVPPEMGAAVAADGEGDGIFDDPAEECLVMRPYATYPTAPTTIIARIAMIAGTILKRLCGEDAPLFSAGKFSGLSIDNPETWTSWNCGMPPPLFAIISMSERMVRTFTSDGGGGAPEEIVD